MEDGGLRRDGGRAALEDFDVISIARVDHGGALVLGPPGDLDLEAQHFGVEGDAPVEVCGADGGVMEAEDFCHARKVAEARGRFNRFRQFGRCATYSGGPLVERVRFLCGESFCRTRFGFGGFFGAVFGRGDGVQATEQVAGEVGDFFDGGVEGGFVGFRGIMEAGNFADELQGRGADFVVGDGRCEVKERFDVAAHAGLHSGGGSARQKPSPQEDPARREPEKAVANFRG